MTSTLTPEPRRWPWFLVGFAFFLLGPISTFVQFNLLDRLSTPWQVPILASLGIFCMLLSVLQRGGALRILGLVFFTLVAGGQWYLMLFGMNTPPYAGPANPGSPLPTFEAKLAKGQPFSNADLAQGHPSVLLFFRGHW